MTEMTHRDRVLHALSHREPDRVPMDFGSGVVSTIVHGAYERLKQHLGVESETVLIDQTSSRVRPDEAILRRFDIDTRMLPRRTPATGASDPSSKRFAGSYRDFWGVTWRLTEDGRQYVEKPPFAGDPTLADLEAHRWPDPANPAFTEGIAARARVLRQSTDAAIVMELPGRVFSMGHFLCGFEDWLMLLKGDRRVAEALLDRGTDIEAAIAADLLAAVGDNVDVILVQDDLGWQNALFVSPELYRSVLKPRHRRLYGAIKSRTSARLLLHSDGAIAPLIGDLIDVGVDAINPVQVSARGMGDTRWLKKQFGAHLTFWGAVDTQRVMPFGSPQEVRDEVRRRIEDLAEGGGYVLAAVHTLQAEVPPENVCALFDAAREFGTRGRNGR